jgi:hypothetical protein
MGGYKEGCLAQGVAYQQLGRRRRASRGEKSQIGGGKVPKVWRIQQVAKRGIHIRSGAKHQYEGQGHPH